jgi:HD-GYP domain-containing protein (c-di-GMP phosphodiesterase class II)
MRSRALDRMIRETVAVRTLELEHEKRALRDLTVQVAEALVNAMEAKDVYLRGHSQRVAALACAMAEVLGHGEAVIDTIEHAARLHDVGKIGIRESILNKNGPLTAEEFAHIQDHVRIGMEILLPLQHLGDALTYIHHHHEHWDGSGYPQGLSGTDISIGGRILTAADAFDALTSARAYRDPLSASTTLDYLRTQTGKLLDPDAFEALSQVVRGGTLDGIPRVT